MSLTVRPSHLPDNTAHLWIADPAAVPDAWYEHLSHDEHVRADAIKHAQTQDTFIRARGLLRYALSHYGDLAPSAWRLIANDHGRPELAMDQRQRWHLRFNVSHTRALVACIVTHDLDIGVDVEDVMRRSATDKIAHRYFSDDEVAQLEAIEDGAARRGRFFDFWTLKEAYIKARGLGLAIPLAKFSFHLEPPALQFTTEPDLCDPARDWQFGLFTPRGGEHRAAFAVRREGRRDTTVTCFELASADDIQRASCEWTAVTTPSSNPTTI